MYLVPLMLLALGMGGVQRGSCYPSRTLEVPKNYYRSLKGDFGGYFDSVDSRLEEIRRNGQAQGREMEVRILRAFIDLEPITVPHCNLETSSKIETVKEVLREGSSATGALSISPKKIKDLEKIVSKMAQRYYKTCFKYCSALLGAPIKANEQLAAALNRMEVFQDFANFSLTAKPLESFQSQANHVLERPEYLDYLQTISNQLHSEAPESWDPFSDSCGYLENYVNGRLDYGIKLLEGAASFGLDLGSKHVHFQHYRNYALCIASREYLIEEKKKATSRSHSEPTQI